MKNKLHYGALIGILVVAIMLAGCQKKETPSVPENLQTVVEQLSGNQKTPQPAKPDKKPETQPVEPRPRPEAIAASPVKNTVPDVPGAVVKTAQRYAVHLAPAASDNPAEFDLHPAGLKDNDAGYFTIPDPGIRNGIRLGTDFGVYGATSCAGAYTVAGSTGKVYGAETDIPGICFWYGEGTVFPLKITANYADNFKDKMKIYAVSRTQAVFETSVASLGQAHGYQYARLWPEFPQDLYGAPVIDTAGEIVGLSLVARYAGAGGQTTVVVPLDAVIKAVNAIKVRPAQAPPAAQDTNRGWFGLKLEELTPDIREALGLSDATSGLLVKQVTQDGPAAVAGVLPGDIVTVFNAIPLTGTVKQLAELSDHIGAGQTVSITVLRHGSAVSLEITTQKKEKP